MTDSGTEARPTDARRQERLAAALRANLKKRKAQARARAGGVDQAARDAGVGEEQPS